MAKLFDLPNEILLSIYDLLWQGYSLVDRKQYDPRVALSALCLVNSTIRMVAQPILLREFSCTAQDDDLLYLMRTIAENAQLRRHVTQLEIGDIQFDQPDVTPALKDAIQSLEVDFAELWIERFSAGPWDERADAIVAVFWALLPNLKRAHFSWPHASGMIMGKLIQTRRIASWFTLEDLAIMQWDAEAEFFFGPAAPMLAMPQLRRVELRQIRTDEDTLDLKPKSAAFKHLRFYETDFAAPILRSIIESCVLLEKVEFCQYAVMNEDGNAPQDVVQLLAIHGATIKMLDIDFFDWHVAHDSDESLHLISQIQTWDAFPVLEQLSIDQMSVKFSPRMLTLPHQLKTLEVEYVNEKFVPAMTTLMLELDEFKQLADIHLGLRRMTDAPLFEPFRARLSQRHIAYYLRASKRP